MKDSKKDYRRKGHGVRRGKAEELGERPQRPGTVTALFTLDSTVVNFAGSSIMGLDIERKAL